MEIFFLSRTCLYIVEYCILKVDKQEKTRTFICLNQAFVGPKVRFYKCFNFSFTILHIYSKFVSLRADSVHAVTFFLILELKSAFFGGKAIEGALLDVFEVRCI
jgi:hypothetical protein